ncbi:MAG: DUF58 domain-containing protein [Actinoplanes sp.]
MRDVRLSGRGARLLAGAVLLLTAGVWADLPVLRVAAAGGLGAVLAAVLVVLRPVRVSVERDVHPREVERGHPALARLVVTNRGRRRTAGFTASDRIGAAERTTVLVPPLRPGASVPRTYELPTARRGEVAVGPLQIGRADPLGLAHRTVATGVTLTLWVLPRVHRVRRAGAGADRGHGTAPTVSPFRGTTDFRSLREYVVGDEPRHVHWKSTARTGQLMVREFTDPQRPSLVVLLDNRAAVLAADLFEEAVEVAASLAAAARADGHDVTLAAVGIPPVGPAAGDRRADRWLCTVSQTDTAGPLEAALAQAPVTAEAVVLTGNGDPAALAGLRARFPRLTVVGFAAATVPTGSAGVAVVSTAAEALAALRAVATTAGAR